MKIHSKTYPRLIKRKLLPKNIISTNKNNLDDNTHLLDKSFLNYLQNFPSINILLKNNNNKEFKLKNLIHTKEYIKANYFLFKNNYIESEKEFEYLKSIIRKTQIGNLNYSIILRRLGIIKLKLNKIRDGLLELENVNEFSQDREYFDYNFRFNSKLELLKCYIQYDPIRASNFAEKLLKNESDLKILDLNQLGILYSYIGLAFFINSSKPYEEIKRLMRKGINYVDNLDEKAKILHNLSIIKYFEIKTHNRHLDHLKKQKEELKNNNNNYETKRENILDNVINKNRIKRKLNPDDKETLEKEQKLLNEIKITDNPIQDEYYKKMLSLEVDDLKKKEKLFLETSQFFDDRKFDEEESYKAEDSLLNSKLNKNEKINLIFHNLEDFNIEDNFEKLLNNQIDYENDLDSILPNLFICLKLKEMDLEDEFGNDINSHFEFMKNNFSCEMDIHNFLLHDKDYLDYYTKNVILFTKDKNPKINLNQLEKFKNKNLEIIDNKEINEFKDISEKDKYFTFIKNSKSIPTVIFLAEIFSENSKNFKEESEFWIKYGLSISYNSNNQSSLIRSFTLAAAYLIDNSNNLNIDKTSNITKAEIILNYLKFIHDNNKDKLTKLDKTTFTMTFHLLGIIKKLNPKLKGEGLALIEIAKNMRKSQEIEERLFFIDMDKDFKFDIDYDKETLEYIESEIKKANRNI